MISIRKKPAQQPTRQKQQNQNKQKLKHELKSKKTETHGFLARSDGAVVQIPPSRLLLNRRLQKCFQKLKFQKRNRMAKQF